MQKENLFSYITVGTLAVFLLLLAGWGWQRGVRDAQSAFVVHQANELSKGLQFFYNDEQRYPSAAEYDNTAFMVKYFGQFPPFAPVSNQCPQNFIYKRPQASAYELAYCLPGQFGQLTAGYHALRP